MDEETRKLVVAETGMPAGWHPLLAGYDALPSLATRLPPVPQDLLHHLTSHERLTPSPDELARTKERLRALYVAGPGGKVDEDESAPIPGGEGDEEEAQTIATGARIPIPAETFLEELSQKMELHPISVYWLLEEMWREEGLVCPPELQRQTGDYFSVKLLRMLGHRWPMQDQYERERGLEKRDWGSGTGDWGGAGQSPAPIPFLAPECIDEDGIIPLTPGTGDETLIQVMRRHLDAEFSPERGPDVEVEAGSILGWRKGDAWGKHKPTTLERWFEREFFKRHVSQFKRRPIAWHLTSPKGTFQAIVYYHKFDKNRLTLLRARYVREVMEGLRRQLGEIKAQGLGTGDWGLDRAALGRMAKLEEQLEDVQEFDRRLGLLLGGRTREARIWCPWKSPAEQPVGWDPDINDGVRVNIAPVQRLGLLKADVLSGKDLKSLLAPESRD